MISFDEALHRVLESASGHVASEAVRLEACLGRYLAEPIRAAVNVPGFDNSAMDGYAVAAGDIEAGKKYVVSQRVAAGQNPSLLECGTVARIFTGAKMPERSDAVILQEDTEVDEDGRVSFTGAVSSGQNVRPAGQDIQNGSLLIESGKRLTAADIGLIASVGVAEVRCAKPLRVAFFSTGDELQQPGTPLDGAQIYNSNRYMLFACLQELGMQPVDLGVCGDNAEKTREILQKASEQADCIITTGGMSVGDEDYVRSEAQALGTLEFWKIAMKPGKPFAMGSINGVPFFGLPGNPVSTYVTFQLLVRPWLLKRMGADFMVEKRAATAAFSFENCGSRLDFLRAQLRASESGELKAALYDNQSSGVLSSIAWADGVVPVAPGLTVCPGDVVELWCLK